MCLNKMLFVVIILPLTSFSCTYIILSLQKCSILNGGNNCYWTKSDFLSSTKDCLAYEEYDIRMIFAILYMSGGFKIKLSKRCVILHPNIYLDLC